MTRRLFLLATAAAALIVGVPTAAWSAAFFDHFTLCATTLATQCQGQAFTPTLTGNGTATAQGNISGTYNLGGRIFVIGAYTTGVGTPVIVGTDGTLDKVSLTNATITYSGTNAGSIDLYMTYGFDFSLPADRQTYGIQASGTFTRPSGLALNDTVLVTSDAFFSCCGEFPDTGSNKIGSSASYTVMSLNTFSGLPTSPNNTEIISCGLTLALDGTCTVGDGYILETVARLHFDKPGDAIRIPNSFDTVACPDTPDPGCNVDDALAALTAADAAALGVPEPNTIALLLGAALGLPLLKQACSRVPRDPRRG